MDVGEGMVAVVRGLQGSGLAVTLLDSGRQFTLLPEAYTYPAPRTNVSYTTASQCASNFGRRESGVQATDGRYTSTYKMMHCHSTPTSPPEQVTEFPPQRAEIYPGQGNFIVGGQGSGESRCYPMKSSEFRGAMCWPDRGSVFSPRPSLQPDSFATSLRKYPNISQDRSSEIVERLINFTQAKNACKNNRNLSPFRNIDLNMSNQTFCLNTKSSRNASTEKLRRGYQPEVIIRPKRFAESPTREISRQEPAKVGELDPWRKPTYCKTDDVRYLKDISRKVREDIRSLSAQPDNRPQRLSPSERCVSANGQRTTLPQWSSDTVNMGIQATVPVTSREIMTLPRTVPSLRTMAVPLTPISSKTDEKSKGRKSDAFNIDKDQPESQMSKIIQTKLSFADIHAQTASSAVEFSFRKKHKRKGKIRSRSEETVQIIELMKYRNASIFKQNGLKSQSYISHRKAKSREIFVEFINKFENKAFNVDMYGKRKYASDKYRPLPRSYQTGGTQRNMENDETLNEILKSWINLIPLKVKNNFDAQKEKTYIQYDFFNYLKRFFRIPPDHIRTDKLKTDILSRLKLIPLDVNIDKVLVLNGLSEILISKIKSLYTGCRRRDININKNRRKNNLKDVNNSVLLPSKKEVEDFILKYTRLCLQNKNLSQHESLLKQVQDKLLDIFVSSLKAISNVDDDNVKKDITLLLHNYGLSEQEANRFSNALIKYFKQTFISDIALYKIRSNTLIVLTSSCCYGSIGNKSDVQLNEIADDDIVTNEKHYTNELCHQINDWLNGLQIQTPLTHEKEVIQDAVNNLAKDIVERHKYLELNSCNEIIDESEIEHLKYQIFKWISKFAGENNLEPVERAPDLLSRIKSIFVPKLFKLKESCGKYSNQFRNSVTNKSSEFDTIRRHNVNISTKTYDIVNKKVLLCDNNLPCQPDVIHDNNELLIKKENNNDSYASLHTKEDNVKSNHILLNDFIQNTNERNVISVPSASTSKKCRQKQTEISKSKIFDIETKTHDQLEAEYEQFVKDWVQNIPMNATDFEHDAILEKARLGIYNGLWKVVSKLNCDPVIYYNRFLYEDLLDDAIDDLLNCLPQSSDLKSKRYLLKVKFIEKTISINDQIKENEEASFKNKLIQNILTDLRKQGLNDNQDGNATKLHEDLQIIKLVENYLLVTKFKNEDKVTSEIYKKKLIREVKDFVSELKKNHAKELKNIDVATYETDIINILNEVPLPSDKTLNQEAYDVLLGMEIEQWYDDLPIISNNDYTEQYYRKKQRDILVNKIKEIENRNDLDASDSPLRNEVSRFLEKTPLAEGESLNINFMVDELVNRLKNQAKYKESLNNKRIELQGPANYDEFSKNISFCSSFITPKSNKSIEGTRYDEISSGQHLCHGSTSKIQRNKNSNSSTKQTRVAIQEPPTYRIFEEERPFSSSFKSDNEQWLSLQNSHSDVSSQTQHIDMHTLPPYIPTVKDDDTVQKKSNIELKDIQQFYQQSNDSHPRETQEITNNYEECMNIKNYQTIPKKITGVSHYQLKNNASSRSKDVSTTVGELNKQIYKNEEDQSTCTYSVECQTNGNKTNFTSQVTAELNTSLQKDKICEAADRAEDDIFINDQSVSRHAIDPTTPVVSTTRRARLVLQEEDGKTRKFSFDNDEYDDIPCKCIERYLKYKQKYTRYPCEMFGHQPPCLPVVFPFPYFI